MICRISKMPLVVVLFLAIGLTCESAEQNDGAANFLKDSENLLSKEWNIFKKNVEVEHSDMDDPEGGKGAFHLKIEDGGFIGQIIPSAVAGNNYTFSAWIKSATGMPQFIKLMGENNPRVGESKPLISIKTLKVTDQWQNCSITVTCPASGNANFRFSFRSGDILVWHPKVEGMAAEPEKPSNL